MASYRLLIKPSAAKELKNLPRKDLDGLYAGDRWSSEPHRWHLAPFGDHWP